MAMNKELITKYCRSILILLASFVVSYYICMVDMADYEIIKMTYFYKGAIGFTILFLILRWSRRNFQIEWISIPFFFAYIAYYVNYMYDHRNDWGNELRDYLIFRYLAVGMLLLLVWDIVANYKESKIKINAFWIITFATFALAFTLKPDNTVAVLWPLIALGFTPLSDTDWDSIEIYASVGILGAFLYIMINSVVLYGDNYIGERFYGSSGIAQNGALLTIAATCAAFLFYKNIVFYKSVFAGLVLAIVMIFIGYLLMIVGSRSAIASVLGLLFAVLVALFVKSIKQLITWIVGMLVLGGTLIGSIAVYAQYRYVHDLSMNRFLWVFWHLGKVNDKSISLGDRIFRAFDSFSSERLSIFVSALKQSSWFGKNALFIFYGETGVAEHAHNNYIDWIFKYGWITGLLLNIWLLLLLVKGTKCAIDNHNITLSYLLIIVGGIFFLSDVQYWSRILAFGIVITQFRYYDLSIAIVSGGD